jgi:hypothetical protein
MLCLRGRALVCRLWWFSRNRQRSTLQFKDEPQHYRMVADPAFPEAALGLTEGLITDSLDHVALVMDQPPLLGSCGPASVDKQASLS